MRIEIKIRIKIKIRKSGFGSPPPAVARRGNWPRRIQRIARAQRNDASRRRQYLTRVNALVGVAGEVSHLAVAARRQPALELGRGIRRPGRGELTGVKSQRQRPFSNRRLHFCRAMWN